MSENSLDRRENNVIARQEEICERGRIFGEFNKAWISGIIEKNFELSHENSWEKFYKTRVCVKRLSGTEDSIPIVVSEILITDLFDKTLKGKYIEAGGQFRSRKIEGEDNRKHLELFLFAKDINICDTESELKENANANLIYLEGYVYKTPSHRMTPLGREITDFMIIVKRDYNKFDIIPCIAWSRIAMYAGQLHTGDKIKLYGRLQSRQYFKRYSPDSEQGEYKEAYEVSIIRIKKV